MTAKERTASGGEGRGSVDRSKIPWLIFMGYVNLTYIYIVVQINVCALGDAI
jgi:hypothetical protein